MRPEMWGTLRGLIGASKEDVAWEYLGPLLSLPRILEAGGSLVTLAMLEFARTLENGKGPTGWPWKTS